MKWTANDVCSVIAALAAAVCAVITAWNTTKLNDVQIKQDAQVQKVQVIKDSLDEAMASTDRKLHSLERSAAAVESKIQVIRPQ